MEEIKPTEALTLIERTEAAIKALKEQNDRAEEIAKRNEEASILIKLGGGTNAGQPAEQIKVETAKEYSERVMTGKVKTQ